MKMYKKNPNILFGRILPIMRLGRGELFRFIMATGNFRASIADASNGKKLKIWWIESAT